MDNESHVQARVSASVQEHTVLVEHKKEDSSTPKLISVTTLSKLGL